jgi:hypothetical protein
MCLSMSSFHRAHSRTAYSSIPTQRGRFLQRTYSTHKFLSSAIDTHMGCGMRNSRYTRARTAWQTLVQTPSTERVPAALLKHRGPNGCVGLELEEALGGTTTSPPRALIGGSSSRGKEQFWPTLSLALKSRDGLDWSATCHGRAHLGTGEPCPWMGKEGCRAGFLALSGQ